MYGSSGFYLCAVPANDGEPAGLFNLADHDFDSALSKTPLDPGESVEGWAFAYLRAPSRDSSQILSKIRLTFTDTLGKRTACEVTPRANAIGSKLMQDLGPVQETEIREAPISDLALIVRYYVLAGWNEKSKDPNTESDKRTAVVYRELLEDLLDEGWFPLGKTEQQ